MKIVFLSPAAQSGGAEAVLLALIGTIRQACPDWALHVISGEEGPLLQKISALGATCETLAFPEIVRSFGESRNSGPPHVASASETRFAQRVDRLTRWGLAGTAALRYGWKLRRRLVALAPTVVHTNGMKMHLLGAAAKLPAVPLIWHMHDYLGNRPAMKPLLRRLSPRCTLIVANSRSVAADLSKTLLEGPPVRVVYNSVDPSVFTPEGPALDLDKLAGLSPPPPATIRIGLVATFAFWKGHDVFLRAAATIPAAVRFYVVGGPVYATAGSQRTFDELRELIDSLGLSTRVGLTGFVTDVPAAMRALDIVVHASTQPEPFGLTIVQAMACCRAVIVSAAGGARELIEPETDALMHPQGDVSGLADAMLRLIKDPELRARLGKAARRSVEHKFTNSLLAEAMILLYKDTAGAAS